jgi:hypothetical protein
VNWKLVRDKVEGASLAVRTSLASGKSLFVDILSGSPEFGALADFVSSGRQAWTVVVNRIRELVETRFDDRYENPWDVALSAYLLALRGVNRDVALVAAEIALTARQTWWARQVALALLAPLVVSDSASSTFLISTSIPPNSAFGPTGFFVATDQGMIRGLMTVEWKPAILPTGSYYALSAQESFPMQPILIGQDQAFEFVPGARDSGRTQFNEMAA